MKATSADARQLGPSRVVQWSIGGQVSEQRFERHAIETALWKIHMLGAEWAKCFDDFGNQTRDFSSACPSNHYRNGRCPTCQILLSSSNGSSK